MKKSLSVPAEATASSLVTIEIMGVLSFVLLLISSYMIGVMTLFGGTEMRASVSVAIALTLVSFGSLVATMVAFSIQSRKLVGAKMISGHARS